MIGDFLNVLRNFFLPFYYLGFPEQRIYWMYLLSAVVIALAVFFLRGGKFNLRSITRYLLPREIILHRSAVDDYVYFLVTRFLAVVAVMPFVIGSEGVAHIVESLLQSLGSAPWSIAPSPVVSLGYTLVIIVAYDFALFIAHYATHRVPFLWEFHKVHHTAEVLTPITAFRVHPIDDLLSFCAVGVCTGLVAGVFQYFVAGELQYVSVFGLNIFLFGYYIAGYNLRHSHCWVAYPSRLSHIFISPAQHQIHHSRAKRHWDKNFGFIFAFWDWAANTLYVPKEREELQFGIAEADHHDLRSPLRLLFVPLVKAGRLVTKLVRRGSGR